MKNINKLLTGEICELETTATILRKRISNAPEGRLRISQKNGGAEYYVETEGV